jgi:hypothetical protein
MRGTADTEAEGLAAAMRCIRGDDWAVVSLSQPLEGGVNYWP